jgi:chitin disaccharide deacetylase
MANSMKIIVTGDDFGKSDDVNNSIELCHKSGILTSASLVATGDAIENAVLISKRNPALGIGVHLAIDEFHPLSELPSSVIDPLTHKFYSREVALQRLKAFKYRSSDLAKEYILQIEKVLNYGISITHLDHHRHLHLYWPALSAMIKVAKNYNIPYIRSQNLLFPKKNMVHKKIYRVFHQWYLRSRRSTTGGYFDLISSDFDKMYKGLMKLIVSNYKTAEIVAHPCKEKEHEIMFLTDKKVISLVKSCNLVSFGNMKFVKGSCCLPKNLRFNYK